MQAGQEGEHIGRVGELKSDKLGLHPTLTPVTPGKVLYGLTFHYQVCPSEGDVCVLTSSYMQNPVPKDFRTLHRFPREMEKKSN